MTRPSTELYPNPAALVDRRIGEMYTALETIIANMPALVNVSNYIENLVSISQAIDASSLGANAYWTGSAPAAGANVDIAHGLTLTDILSYEVLVLNDSGQLVKPDGTDLIVTVDATNINIAIGASATAIAENTYFVHVMYKYNPIT